MSEKKSIFFRDVFFSFFFFFFSGLFQIVLPYINYCTSMYCTCTIHKSAERKKISRCSFGLPGILEYDFFFFFFWGGGGPSSTYPNYKPARLYISRVLSRVPPPLPPIYNLSPSMLVALIHEVCLCMYVQNPSPSSNNAPPPVPLISHRFEGGQMFLPKNKTKTRRSTHD